MEREDKGNPLLVLLFTVVVVGFLVLTFLTLPVSLFLIGSVALLILAWRSEREWLHSLVPFFTAVTCSFAFVWLVSLFVMYTRIASNADRVGRAEEFLLNAHEWLGAHTSLNWPVLIAPLAILGIISCWLPLTKLLPRALTLKKWIGTANLVLLIITQFTF